MRILILGNGFDIDHGLPTRYTDFLEFIRHFFARRGYAINLSEDKKPDVAIYVDAFFESGEVSHFEEYISNNFWIHHFLNTTLDEDWIDFESEIYKNIKWIDEIWENEDDAEENKKFSEWSNGNLTDLRNYIARDECLNSIQINSFSTLRNKLLTDLTDLIAAFEIYLRTIVEKIEISGFNPAIIEARPDKVLSFNYTNTYERMYMDLEPNVECYHIHGQIEKQNMILGIDEYLDESQRGKDLLFIDFQKHFQRIHKRTGNRYLQWLDEIKGNGAENEAFFFGHSFGKTDKDTIGSILVHPQINSTIYYHSEEEYRNIVVRLYAILGTEKLTEYVSRTRPKIRFELQPSRKSIESGGYQIYKDIRLLNKLPFLPKVQAEKMIRNIYRRIDTQDTGYFITQERIIWLVDTMQEYQLLDDARIQRILKTMDCSEIERADGFIASTDFIHADIDGGTYWNHRVEMLIDHANIINTQARKAIKYEFVPEIFKNLIENENWTENAYRSFYEWCMKNYESNSEVWGKCWKALVKVTELNYSIALEVLHEMKKTDDRLKQILIHVLIKTANERKEMDKRNEYFSQDF